MKRRTEGEAEARGASCRDRTRSPNDNHIANWRGGFGRDPDNFTVVLERLTAPGLEKHLEALLQQASTPVEPFAKGGILDGPVAQPRDDGHASAADQIQHRDIFCQPNRIVKRCQQSRDADPDGFSTARQRASQDQGRRQEPVIDTVVLRDHEAGEPVAICPLRHLDARLVKRLRGSRAEGGRSKIKAEVGESHRKP